MQQTAVAAVQYSDHWGGGRRVAGRGGEGGVSSGCMLSINQSTAATEPVM